MYMDHEDLEEACATMCSTLQSFLMEHYPLDFLKREKIEERLSKRKKKLHCNTKSKPY